MVLACDLPYLSLSLLNGLQDAWEPGMKALGYRSPDGVQPLCAIYGLELLPEIRRRVKSGKLAVYPLLEAP